MAKQSTKKTDYINELMKTPILESANLHATSDDSITLIREYKFLQDTIGIVYNRRTNFFEEVVLFVQNPSWFICECLKENN